MSNENKKCTKYEPFSKVNPVCRNCGMATHDQGAAKVVPNDPEAGGDYESELIHISMRFRCSEGSGHELSMGILGENLSQMRKSQILSELDRQLAKVEGMIEKCQDFYCEKKKQ